MKVREAMSRPVETIAPDARVAEAAVRMRDKSVGALPVLHEERVVGMLTDRDITVRVTAARRDPERTFAADVMSQPVISCLAEDEVTHAARLMVRSGVRRITVLSVDGELVGILSVDDIAILFADEQPGHAAV